MADQFIVLTAPNKQLIHTVRIDLKKPELAGFIL